MGDSNNCPRHTKALKMVHVVSLLEAQHLEDRVIYRVFFPPYFSGVFIFGGVQMSEGNCAHSTLAMCHYKVPNTIASFTGMYNQQQCLCV